MNHYFKDHCDSFNFARLYEEMADQFPDGHFVQLGIVTGRSTIYMVEYILGKQYNIKFDVCDWNLNKDLYDEFIHHLTRAHLPKNSCNIYNLPSLELAGLYSDESLSFVFIDMDIAGWGVYNNLEAFYPKLMMGGFIAGHDLEQPDVERSVRRFKKENYLEYDRRDDMHCYIFEKY